MLNDATLPGIAIVTIALNAERDLALTLESAIAQDYPDTQLVVIDGTSWDDSLSVLERYRSDVDRLIICEDAGIYFAMNQALDHVTKEYVIFLNAGDQFYSADAISRMVEALEGDPDIFYGKHIYVDRRREFYKRSAAFDLLAGRLDEGKIDPAWHNAIPCHQATFARAGLLRRLRFDTRLQVAADHDLLFRAHASGAQFQYVDEIVAHYHGGGYSALMGDRTRLEGAATYRMFSRDPAAIDRYFYPDISPFDPQTERTGIRLSGFYPNHLMPESVRMQGYGDWVAASGCVILSPASPSGGLDLQGLNRIEGQSIDVLLDDSSIGVASIPIGSFRVELSFAQEVPGGGTITLRPTKADPDALGDAARDQLALSLSSFRFQDSRQRPQYHVARGTSLEFRAGNYADLLAILGSGWSAPEYTHLWSIGATSDFWIRVAPDVRRLALRLSGNPHASESGQRITLLVNQEIVQEDVSYNGGGLTMEIDCTASHWLSGRVNHVALHLSCSARPPLGSGDLRDLGVCVFSLSAID